MFPGGYSSRLCLENCACVGTMKRDRVSTRLPLGFLGSAAATEVWLDSALTSSRFDLAGILRSYERRMSQGYGRE